MKVYTYSEARQNLSDLLNQAQTEEVIIRRRDGTVFSLKAKKTKKSPFDVKGIKTKVLKEQILDAVR
ncbi:MAG: type II toxin-antitoxin system prevent-host-death family antitoxin, partial [Thermodesulfobacteriota bacterium]